MLRHFYWGRSALFLAASLFAIAGQVNGQEANDADVEASANEENTSADASAEASGEPSDTQAEADVNADASANEKTDATAKADSDADADANSDSDADASAQQDDDQQSSSDSRGEAEKRSDSFPVPSNEDRDADRSRQDTDDARQQTSQQRSGTDRNQAGADSRNQQGSRQSADSEQKLRRGVKFGQANDRGLTINTVDRNSWYYNSGFRQGDVIVSVFGRPVRSDADFYRIVVLQPGQRVPVIILRNGQRETIYIEQDVVHAHHRDARQGTSGGAYLGVTFQADVRDAAIVNSVNPDSPAQEAGIQAGDVIVALNDKQARNYQDVIRLVGSMRPGDELEIVVDRDRNEERFFATLDAKPNLRTATRRSDMNVERTRLDQSDEQVEVYRDGEYQGRARDRQIDGRGDRGLLPSRRN